MPNHCFYARSALFVPAANARAMAKTLTLDIDTVIYDLEDAVADTAKQSARHTLSSFFNSGCRPGFVRVIRINAVATPQAMADIELVQSLQPDAILLPKVEDAETISQAAAMLASGMPKLPALWAMIEKPKAILQAPAIAAHPAITTLVAGPNDIAAATDIRPGQHRQHMHPWLMQIVLAGKAYGRCVLDGVFNDLQDQGGFEQECQQAAAMGFDGKTLIHPSQIAIANLVFQPTQEAVAQARAIVAAFREPGNAARGVITLEGKMVERLHLEQAQKLLQKYELTRNKPS